MSPFVRFLSASLLFAFAAPAAAQTVSTVVAARSAGIVGERYDGYLGFAATPTEQIRRQVGSINIRRRSLYTGLAARRGVNLQAVGIAAGCELLAQVKVGEVYMLNDGAWRRRVAGQAVSMPSYCAR